MSSGSPTRGEPAPGPAGDRLPDARQATLDAIEAAAYLVDDANRIQALNARAEELLGRLAGQLLGRDVHDALHRNRYGGLGS